MHGSGIANVLTQMAECFSKHKILPPLKTLHDTTILNNWNFYSSSTMAAPTPQFTETLNVFTSINTDTDTWK